MSDWADPSKGTIPERVYGFIWQSTPAPVCDDCAAKATGVPRENVNPLTQTLGLTSDFAKARGTCTLCQASKLVTRSLRYA